MTRIGNLYLVFKIVLLGTNLQLLTLRLWEIWFRLTTTGLKTVVREPVNVDDAGVISIIIMSNDLIHSDGTGRTQQLFLSGCTCYSE